MDTEQVLDQFDRIYPLTREAREAFQPLFESVELDKNEYLTREGEWVHHACFLEEGLIRVFYGQDGTEYNKTFFLPGMFPTALTALLSQAPCQLNFQALTSSRLVQFSFHRFRELFKAHQCLESLMLRILEQEWIKKETHDIRMVINDASTNYLLFRKEFPGLENQIPQYHIASYLGITPVQLSRIRARLAFPEPRKT